MAAVRPTPPAPPGTHLMPAANRPSRRSALRLMLAAAAAPAAYRAHAAAPSSTLLHASFGAAGMAGADLNAITACPGVTLAAVAEVDQSRLKAVTTKFPNVRVYSDWRKLLDAEKDLHSVNVSTPDHMHAPIAMRAVKRGLHVYGQKPLTQTIYEARQLTRAAAEAKLVTQMGIQIHSHEVHKTVVKLVQDGAVGKIKEVYSWSGKGWGDPNPVPTKSDPVPAGLNWDGWLGVADDRPYVGGGYYHPGNWRKRVDFGTGTFGDMGCHILDPVFTALALTAPTAVRSDGPATAGANWPLDTDVTYTFPGTKFTADTLTLHWTGGDKRPPAELQKQVGGKVGSQGSIYVGTEGVMYSPYIAAPQLFPADKFGGYKVTKVPGTNHYAEFVEACRGNGATSTPFAYSGPLTESVLLGCLATRFPQSELAWDAANLKVTNVPDANRFVRRTYRKGWEVEGL